MTLTELARKYGSDKVYNPSTKVGHGYMPFYESLLEGRNVLRVLEIGIGTVETMTHVSGYRAGASLRMWEEHFPLAEIFALDICPDVLINEGRIRSRQCDQGSREELLAAMADFGGNFDLIVDDGSHIYEHQILSAQTLLPFLSADGVYIVEDVIGFPMPLPGYEDWPILEHPFNIQTLVDDRIMEIRKKLVETEKIISRLNK